MTVDQQLWSPHDEDMWFVRSGEVYFIIYQLSQSLETEGSLVVP